MVGRFVVVCRRRGLKFNACKNKGMVVGREEGLICKVLLYGTKFEHMSEFKYMGYVLNESYTDGAEYVVGKWRVGAKWPGLSGP